MIIDENSEMTQISKARNGWIARIRKCSPMKWGTPPLISTAQKSVSAMSRSCSLELGKKIEGNSWATQMFKLQQSPLCSN